MNTAVPVKVEWFAEYTGLVESQHETTEMHTHVLNEPTHRTYI